MTRVITLMALAAPGLSEAPVHEPVHARGPAPSHSATVRNVTLGTDPHPRAVPPSLFVKVWGMPVGGEPGSAVLNPHAHVERALIASAGVDNEIVNPEEAPDREPERPCGQREADQMYRREGPCCGRLSGDQIFLLPSARLCRRGTCSTVSIPRIG